MKDLDDRKSKKSGGKRKLEQTVASIPLDELRAFVVQLAEQDETIRNRILVTYGEVEDSVISLLKRQIDGILRDCSDRYGYIDYNDANDFSRKMVDFLHGHVLTLIERGQLWTAFTLTNYVVEKAGNCDIDDSNGDTQWIIEECQETWREILGHADEALEKRIFQWFMSLPSDFVINYMDVLNNFVVENFHKPEQLQEKLQWLQGKIEELEAENPKSWHATYEIPHWALVVVDIMKELGTPQEERIAYRNRYCQYSSIRKVEIQEFLEAGDYDNAIRVLQESKKLDTNSPGLLSNCSEKLIALFEKLGRQEDYQNELLYQVFECYQCDLTYIQKLKAVSTAEEWEQLREEILTAHTCQEVHYLLLEAEGLYERLMKEISQSNNIRVLVNYEKTLLPHFPDTVRNLYTAYVRETAEQTANRRSYAALMFYLKRLRACPGGEQTALAIAAEWKETYRRRSAMMDELKKAGF